MFCVKCQIEIPELRETPSGTEDRIRLLIREGKTMMAIAELRSATGWPLERTKLWVVHRGYPCGFDRDHVPIAANRCAHRTPDSVGTAIAIGMIRTT